MIGCDSGEKISDAYGNFEADPVMVSSQAKGMLISLALEEGMRLKENEIVGVVDTTLLHLKKAQLIAAKRTATTKVKTINAQLAAQQVQIDNLQREYQRVQNLLEGGAATKKQIDDISGNIALLKAQKASLETRKSTIYAELKSFDIQLMQISDQIEKSKILNPITGIVLQKYKRYGETAVPGQIVYKIANMDHLFLRAYISGDQLSKVHTGQEVTVRYDIENGVAELPGIITWIAANAEFTPKVIQTREERVNLVYAIKIKVENDGSLKIGMPGEVVL